MAVAGFCIPESCGRSRNLTVNEKSFSLGLLDHPFTLDEPAETMALSSPAGFTA